MLWYYMCFLCATSASSHPFQVPPFACCSWLADLAKPPPPPPTNKEKVTRRLGCLSRLGRRRTGKQTQVNKRIITLILQSNSDHDGVPAHHHHCKSMNSQLKLHANCDALSVCLYTICCVIVVSRSCTVSRLDTRNPAAGESSSSNCLVMITSCDRQMIHTLYYLYPKVSLGTVFFHCALP